MMGRIFNITSGKEITDNPVKAGEDCETRPLDEREIAGFIEIQTEDNAKYLRQAKNEGLNPKMRDVEYVIMALRDNLKEVDLASKDKFSKKAYEIGLEFVDDMNDERLIGNIISSKREDWIRKTAYCRMLLIVALKRCGAECAELV